MGGGPAPLRPCSHAIALRCARLPPLPVLLCSLHRLRRLSTLPARLRCCVPAAEEGSRESVDAKCMKLTAPWVRERAQQEQDIETCGFYDGLDAAGPEGRLDAGEPAR